jgi:sulfur carrier protein
MKLIINGIEKDFEVGVSMAQIIEILQIDGKVMAAAVNMQIIKKENWQDCKLQENDKIELLQFVGGG